MGQRREKSLEGPVSGTVCGWSSREGAGLSLVECDVSNLGAPSSSQIIVTPGWDVWTLE